MTIHLLRMAVGIEDVVHLRRVQQVRLAEAEDGRLFTFTRNTPKRAEELIDGGSLYWIVKGYVRVRQRVLAVERRTDQQGRGRCALELDPRLVATVLQARRPQQGWRYLDPADAPPDRSQGDSGEDDLPEEMAKKLRDLGLI